MPLWGWLYKDMDEDIKNAKPIRDINISTQQIEGSSEATSPVKTVESVILPDLVITEPIHTGENIPTTSEPKPESQPSTSVEKPKGKNKTVNVSDDAGIDRKSTRLNSSHIQKSRMPSSA